jgi:uncharacterized protein (DUF1501 family)
MKESDDKSRRRFLKAGSMLGLVAAFRPATIGKAFADSKSNTPQKENPMTLTNAKQAADKTAIRPFQVNVPEGELTELRRRINSTRWPDRRRSRMNRKACRWRQFGNLPGIGAQTTIGASARRN